MMMMIKILSITKAVVVMMMSEDITYYGKSCVHVIAQIEIPIKMSCIMQSRWRKDGPTSSSQYFSLCTTST